MSPAGATASTVACKRLMRLFSIGGPFYFSGVCCTWVAMWSKCPGSSGRIRNCLRIREITTFCSEKRQQKFQRIFWLMQETGDGIRENEFAY
jgi:hypothetical protein